MVSGLGFRGLGFRVHRGQGFEFKRFRVYGFRA